MLIDTHTHLYLDTFDADRDEVIRKAMEAGVDCFLLPNIDSSSINRMLSLEQKYPGKCYPMMGLHPCSVQETVEEELQLVRQWLDQRPFIAIGEIGIDLYWDKTFIEQQKRAFLVQTQWAMDLDIPIVIHSRESIDLILDLLEPLRAPNLRGVFHCFTGSIEQASRVVNLGFLMGIGGVVTFKNGGLDKIMSEIALKDIILETDAPYLAPVPFRGKRNESSYLKLIAEQVAALKDLPVEEIEKISTENAQKLFRLN